MKTILRHLPQFLMSLAVLLLSTLAAHAAEVFVSASPAEFSSAESKGMLTVSVVAEEGAPVSVKASSDEWIVFPAGDTAVVKLARKGNLWRGTAKIRFTLTQNPSSIPRTASISVNDGAASTVATQKGTPCRVSVDARQLKLPYFGGSGSLAVSAPAGCEWEASAATASEWLTVSFANGTGRGTVFWGAAPNEAATRSGRIVVTLKAAEGAKGNVVPVNFVQQAEGFFNPPKAAAAGVLSSEEEADEVVAAAADINHFLSRLGVVGLQLGRMAWTFPEMPTSEAVCPGGGTAVITRQGSTGKAVFTECAVTPLPAVAADYITGEIGLSYLSETGKFKPFAFSAGGEVPLRIETYRDGTMVREETWSFDGRYFVNSFEMSGTISSRFESGATLRVELKDLAFSPYRHGVEKVSGGFRSALFSEGRLVSGFEIALRDFASVPGSSSTQLSGGFALAAQSGKPGNWSLSAPEVVETANGSLLGDLFINGSLIRLNQDGSREVKVAGPGSLWVIASPFSPIMIADKNADPKSVVITSVTGVTFSESAFDYAINATDGGLQVFILPVGHIPDGEVVKITYETKSSAK